jgi:hypothetical protein
MFIVSYYDILPVCQLLYDNAKNIYSTSAKLAHITKNPNVVTLSKTNVTNAAPKKLTPTIESKIKLNNALI